MQTRSKVVSAIIVILIVLLPVYNALNPRRVPDPQLIQSQIDSAVAAANNKNVSGLMAIVSDNYSDSNIENQPQLALLLRRSLSGSQNVDVKAAPPNIVVTGETATSSGVVSINVDGSSLFSQIITLTWQKEPTHRYLVIPDHTWRVVHASYASNIVGD